jgi:hypothetical protein
MKKITLLLCLLISGLALAQEKTVEKAPELLQDVNKKHELKLNTFNLIVLSSLDVSYEKLVNRNSSFGVSLFYNFNDINDDLYFPKKFSLTPYYRWFFTEKRFARGFFVEGFGSLNTFEERSYYYYNGYNDGDIIKETNFAIGISVGGKFVIKSGFVAEVYFGVGRNLFNNNSNNNHDDSYSLENNIITRGGISLGYRF